MTWTKPTFSHIEQLQLCASTADGSSASNRTAPQWQPPARQVRGAASASLSVGAGTL
jgi:hypothetical protein